MKLFTVGPVEMFPDTLNIYARQEPYFRTPEFSEKMLYIERAFLNSINAPDNAKFACLTSSGTGAMEAAVVNCLTEKDKVLILDGGSFGRRFVEICEMYGIPNYVITVPMNVQFDCSELEKYKSDGFTALLVNMCETSVGRLYDMNPIGRFCKENGIYLIVDGVSAYLADYVDMTQMNIDVFLTASQKALAISPGLALIALSDRIYEERIKESKACFYFNLFEYIKNQERGQTPFTCAVNSVIALEQRMQVICSKGIDAIVLEHEKRATYFRNISANKLADFNIKLPNHKLSNSCTPLLFENIDAKSVYEQLKKEYGLILCPSGGLNEHKLLRIGHLGNLTFSDYRFLLDVFIKVLQKEN